MRMTRPLLESNIVPTSLGSSPQRIQRLGSVVSEPVICFVLMKFMAHLSWETVLSIGMGVKVFVQIRQTKIGH
jgi:hypothetical protein